MAGVESAPDLVLLETEPPHSVGNLAGELVDSFVVCVVCCICFFLPWLAGCVCPFAEQGTPRASGTESAPAAYPRRPGPVRPAA